jgi:hypothetical protein
LDALASEIPQGLILIFRTSLSKVNQELDYSVLGYSGHADSGTYAITFNQATQDLNTFLEI